MGRTLLTLCLLASAVPGALSQPATGEMMALSDVKAGQRGEVWTVFQGSRPEPFSVEVSGVILNALGPGKSVILCRLTDPRVQDMGAVAGMSGSPLYIDGKFAGALSYQMQHFETVRFAGFTPAADMAEVGDRVGTGAPAGQAAAGEPAGPTGDSGPAFRAMKPVFALGGVSPRTASIMEPQFESIGLGVVAMGGSSQSGQGAAAAPAANPALEPGDAVSVALTTGDITLAGTGTVSRVDGDRIIAFGHPMMGLGDVQLPMCSADVVAILPSTYESFKLANIGPVIGTISQDRLSAVSGLLGPGPEMTDVQVVSKSGGSPERTIRFQVVRDKRIEPMIMLTGVVEGLFGSNDSQPAEGFRIRTTVNFSPTQQITRESVYAGQQGFLMGMFEFLVGLSAELQNPFEKALPTSVQFRIEPLEDNPAVTIEQFQVSRTTVRAGETFQVTLGWRNFQGAEDSSTVNIPVDPSWTGKTLEVIVAPGRVLDELTGHGRMFRPGQLRSFDAYLDAMKGSRPEDGLCVAVVEKSSLFFDQASSTPEAPASIERIAGDSDSARYQRRDALIPLWETRVLEGKVSFTDYHKTVRVVE
jgi:SpoIVB peptidase S55